MRKYLWKELHIVFFSQERVNTGTGGEKNQSSRSGNLKGQTAVTKTSKEGKQDIQERENKK